MPSKLISGIAACAAIFVLGCASTPVPAARFADAKAAIRAADEVGAEHEPVAALHLRLAREQFTLAERLAARGENERALEVLKRSEADAELALALAREDSARAEAARAAERADALAAALR